MHRILREAFLQSYQPLSIVESFKLSGICPIKKIIILKQAQENNELDLQDYETEEDESDHDSDLEAEEINGYEFKELNDSESQKRKQKTLQWNRKNVRN